MAYFYTCPRGHRWEGEFKGSVTNPCTRVICPTCGLLALTPVRRTETPPAAHPSQDTLTEPTSKPWERTGEAANETTLPDLSIERLLPLVEAARQQSADHAPPVVDMLCVPSASALPDLSEGGKEMSE